MIKLFKTTDFFLGSMCAGLGCWHGFVFMHVLVFFASNLCWPWAKFFKELGLKFLPQAT
jgi:hypothetical protein